MSHTSSQAALFAALGDSTRLQLVDRLGSGNTHSISGLSCGMKLSRQGITKHLRVLENAGIVKSARVGREIQFSLKPDSLVPLQNYLETISIEWDDALQRLQTYLERK